MAKGAPIAIFEPSSDKDTDTPNLSPVESPLMFPPISVHVPNWSSNILTRPVLLFALLTPIATLVPSAERVATPEKSLSASPTISDPILKSSS